MNAITENAKAIIPLLGLLVALGGYALNDQFDVVPDGSAKFIAFAVGAITIVVNYFTPNTTDNPLRVVGRSVKLKGEKPLPEASAA